MSKYWTRTTLFADGGNVKHFQRGEVRVGPTAKEAKPTGITWECRQYHDRRQAKDWWFNGVSYPSEGQALAAYEASREKPA